MNTTEIPIPLKPGEFVMEITKTDHPTLAFGIAYAADGNPVLARDGIGIATIALSRSVADWLVPHLFVGAAIRVWLCRPKQGSTIDYYVARVTGCVSSDSPFEKYQEAA